MPVQRRGMRALLIWCQRVTQDYRPKVDVQDLTSSFRDGLAFCAIIHHFRPELIGDFSRLRPDDVLANNRLAFTVAEEALDIPSLLDPEDMAECEEPDKFSVVTYLSQFYHLFKDQDQSRGNVTTNTVTTEGSGDSNSKLSRSSESENDSLLSSSSEATPIGTPKSVGGKKQLLFNQAELIAKYGEEIFSVSKENNSNNGNADKTEEEEEIVDPAAEDNGLRKVKVQSKVRVDSPMVKSKFAGGSAGSGVSSICSSFEEKMKIFEKRS